MAVSGRLAAASRQFFKNLGPLAHHAVPEKLSVDPAHHPSCWAVDCFQKVDQPMAKKKKKNQNMKKSTQCVMVAVVCVGGCYRC